MTTILHGQFAQKVGRTAAAQAHILHAQCTCFSCELADVAAAGLQAAQIQWERPFACQRDARGLISVSEVERERERVCVCVCV